MSVFTAASETEGTKRLRLTLMTLEGRDLGPGVGLGAFRLMRLASPESAGPAARPRMLLGRDTRFAATAADLGAGAGAGAVMVTAAGRTNMPRPMGQSK